MENSLLVGLSRQMVLERQMDVVANNVANVNTNGYKADKSLFQEYLKTGAREDNFVGRDRAVSFVLDSGSFKDFAQGPSEQTKNPLDVAIDGGGFLVVQTAAGERYTRDGGLQINNQGQLVTAAGDAVLGTSGPIVFQPTDHDVSIADDGEQAHHRNHQFEFAFGTGHGFECFESAVCLFVLCHRPARSGLKEMNSMPQGWL